MRFFEENRSDITAEMISHRQRCIQILTKELLLAQSSDWGFLMKNEPSREYAEKRTRDHFANFDRVWAASLHEGAGALLDEIEQENPVFPDLPWNMYEPYA